MAMLADRKIKQKWSQDPRNKAWSSDTDRFGYQMLTKMGWSDGKGLGASESGSTSHVKISLKNDNLGVGAKVSHDDNWLAHQDDFNDLLAQLNNANNTGKDGGDQSARNDMESIARKSKKRVFYERFIKSKNTSSYSATDMACILGKRSKSAPDTPVDQSEDEDSDGSCASCPALRETNSLGLTTINSSQSVQEYFAMKMAELKKKRQQRQTNEEGTEGNPTEGNFQGLKRDEARYDLELQDQTDGLKKKRKQKREKNDKEKSKNNDECPEEMPSSDLGNGGQHVVSETDKKKEKKKKKDRKRKLEENEEVVEKKRRQKLSIEETHKGGYDDGSEEENKESKKKKKKKKAKKEQVESEISTKIEESVDRVSNKTNKYKLESSDFEENPIIRDKKKQKKKRKQSTNENNADVDTSKKDKKTKSKTTKEYSKKR